ncbi:ectonucleoside triphosphate diphosphohydrolase 8 [Carlito syrichta]|uniref:Ectonucleoside triphosphate diphosphohydrolase 8 n=1 Tax=Carlito syrichta TaxID=1868482 RepID=A0A3Q0EJE7_CARSF|nr:ectonucleoside triphosphate diphosphohydrolase 8 [Carlito syrichta]
MGWSWKKPVFTALLGAAVASGLTVLVLILVEATNVLLSPDIKFGIVFDAGSSHTALFVYQWPADKENGTGVVSQALACQVEGPGISAYTSNPTRAGESLQGCLQEALALIPETQHRKTPLFLGATAGMRLLSQKNSSQARDIFAAVTQVLARAPVDFRGAEILAGRDEGAFGWITINYLLGMLVKVPRVAGGGDQGVCLGLVTLPGGRTWGQGWGWRAGAGVSVARPPQRQPAGPLRHPCYHSGYRATLDLAPLSESPCVHTAAPRNLAQNRTVEGTGSPGECVSAIRELFDFSCQHAGSCAFDGVYQPPLHGRFYAFSSFYYTLHFLNLTSGQSLSLANATVWEFCNKTWKLVEASYPGQDRWLRDYCASGLYILTLLHQGYGFSEETWPRVEFHKQAGGTDIGWTLGYMLNLTGLIPAEAPAQGRAQSHGVWATGVVFVALTLVAVLMAAAVQLAWREGPGEEAPA